MLSCHGFSFCLIVFVCKNFQSRSIFEVRDGSQHFIGDPCRINIQRSATNDCRLVPGLQTCLLNPPAWAGEGFVRSNLYQPNEHVSLPWERRRTPAKRYACIRNLRATISSKRSIYLSLSIPYPLLYDYPWFSFML